MFTYHLLNIMSTAGVPDADPSFVNNPKVELSNLKS